ncbi:hypothetical protein [Salininema proteolyticum]|uniref:DUF2116 family Zn-ribbon domain-containing protein n=1 Tax=Salininema proteolyticum TaxID=1607685 RepID=A0ABV8TTX7_9ACTN
MTTPPRTHHDLLALMLGARPPASREPADDAPRELSGDACAHCGTALAVDGPSGDYCSEDCQTLWSARRLPTPRRASADPTGSEASIRRQAAALALLRGTRPDRLGQATAEVDALVQAGARFPRTEEP